ncbi:2-octaprenylphenol hydroxylase [Neobacillus bataviensis]|uniref:2-octaprenylphenol hydroxylase n=1 Tax=Neobacillus bataviensis TaxID=220685 RepID=A0A561DZ86_9BACI|nr:AarF/ABC1/UbiB kinase family protein [Neobacillus bataviensis]TWE08679.1 2-octaprenylphenol hydroxylase [Neobacillus bataviensis]
MGTNGIRRLNRYREIVSLLVKHGFGYIVQEVGLTDTLTLKDRLISDFKQGNSQEMGYRLRHLLEELGPTFIKLGQLLSIRSDLLPVEVIRELELLQDHVNQVSINEIKDKIQLEFGQAVEDIFVRFNETPVGSASIGQVHEALLPTGQEVMVKIQRPKIKETVLADLEIIKDLSKMMENHYDWAEHYHITDLMDELSESIKNELDYMKEGRNTETIQLQFENHNGIKVPEIYWEYTTAEILSMERIDGIKITEIQQLNLTPEEKRQIADRLIESFVTQILREGFFHGDPHPGNIHYIPETKQLGFIDLGQIGRLSARKRYDVTTLMIGLMNEDTDLIVKAMYRLTYVPTSVDNKRFYDDIDRVSKKFSHTPLGEWNFGLTINELFSISHNHQIYIPTDFMMLGKTLITLEGIISDINPSLNLLELAKPYAQQLLVERYNPVKFGKRLWNDAEDMAESFTKIPGQLEEVLQKTSEGDLKVKISVHELDDIFTKIDRLSNKFSFSLTLLAFSIVVLGLIVGATFGTNTILTSIHALEVGFVIAFMMFLWIIYSIIKTGRF